MIKEDYCSFETAKLLKEKGFDEECRAYWDSRIDDLPKEYEIIRFTEEPIHQPYDNMHSIRKRCLAPTHQMAMKWLREVHNILITIIPQEIGLGFDKLCYGIYRITEDLYQPLYNGKLDNLVNSYEEAAEAGIKYCLKNLI